MNEGLLRQRRNLIVTNLVVLLLCLANVKIDEFSFLGIKFSFAENQSVAYQFIWAIWGYFLYRYFVYFLEDAPGELERYWTREFEKSVNPAIKKIVHREHVRLNDACLYSYFTVKRNGWIYKGQKFYSQFKEQSGKEEDFIENISMPIDRGSVILFEFYGLIRFALLTPAVTNYIFPLVLSLIVLGISFYATWPGNLAQIFT